MATCMDVRGTAGRPTGPPGCHDCGRSTTSSLNGRCRACISRAVDNVQLPRRRSRSRSTETLQDIWLRSVALRVKHDRQAALYRALHLDVEPAWYTEIGESIVPAHVRRAANAALTLCVSVLEIPRPELRWFEPETAPQREIRLKYGPDELDQFSTGSNVVGQADREAGVMRVRSGLSVPQVMQTVAHEARHFAQEPHVDFDTYADNERDAEAFAAEFAAAYLTEN